MRSDVRKWQACFMFQFATDLWYLEWQSFEFSYGAITRCFSCRCINAINVIQFGFGRLDTHYLNSFILVYICKMPVHPATIRCYIDNGLLFSRKLCLWYQYSSLRFQQFLLVWLVRGGDASLMITALDVQEKTFLVICLCSPNNRRFPTSYDWLFNY